MYRRHPLFCALVMLFTLVCTSPAGAQPADESRFVADVGAGIDASVNGNVNSGVIGTLSGQAAAILPNPYGAVYGNGLHFRFGGGYVLDEASEVRAVFTYQSADADLVRMGDVGASPLYAQYTDYKTLSLDVGYRRYIPVSNTRMRFYGEGTIGLAFIDEIDVLFAAPQGNLVFESTDFYDQASAFTWGINAGVLFPVAERLDLNFQLGLRSVSGLPDVDQFAGTGLEDINSDSARLTVPVVFGVRFRF
jgi:hypothetical protein